MQKTAIYGGSFDPIHKGHTYIINSLIGVFDNVIVVPSFVSPFKALKQGTSANDRLNMLKLAVSNLQIPKNKSVQISTFEIDKKDISYTIDTLKHYSKTNQELYFVIGSESLSTLHLWRDFEKIKALTAFYIINRKGFFGKTSTDKDVRLIFSSINPPDISSSLIKPALALDRAESMLDDCVLDYIKQNKLYDDYNKFVESYAVFGLSQKKIEHTFNAVKYGIYLAKIYNADIQKTITALLLHDIAKNADTKVLKDNNIQTSIDDMPFACRHAFIGANIARDYFGIDDNDIINAIRYHTTARPNMSMLEKIVTLSDSLEEGRRFLGIEKIRRASTTNLDKAMYLMLLSSTNHLKQTNQPIYHLSNQALEYYYLLNKEI